MRTNGAYGKETTSTFAQYIETVEDDFDDGACVHCFDVNKLVLDDLDFINYFIFLEFGNGEFEVSVSDGKVSSIKYITDDKDELCDKFIDALRCFIDNELKNYFAVAGIAYFH